MNLSGYAEAVVGLMRESAGVIDDAEETAVSPKFQHRELGSPACGGRSGRGVVGAQVVDGADAQGEGLERAEGGVHRAELPVGGGGGEVVGGIGAHHKKSSRAALLGDPIFATVGGEAPGAGFDLEVLRIRCRSRMRVACYRLARRKRRPLPEDGRPAAGPPPPR